MAKLCKLKTYMAILFLSLAFAGMFTSFAFAEEVQENKALEKTVEETQEKEAPVKNYENEKAEMPALTAKEVFKENEKQPKSNLRAASVDKVEYEWSVDYACCKAAWGNKIAQAKVTTKVIKYPTQEKQGIRKYTATFDVAWAETITKEVKTPSLKEGLKEVGNDSKTFKFIGEYGRVYKDEWVNEDIYADKNGICHWDEWVKSSNNKWQYRYADGKYAKNEIVTISVGIDEYEVYNFDKEGYLKSNCWEKTGSTWYYFGEGGKAKTGWFQLGGKGSNWYYAKPNGKLLTNDWVNDTWYARSNGACYKNEWIKSSNGKYWYSPAEGEYPHNCISQINGYMYSFDKSGYVRTNCFGEVDKAKYYFGEGGWALTGWIKAHGEWYYGQKDGKLLTDSRVNDTWYANANGVCHKDEWVKTSNGKWKYLTAKGEYLKDGINKVNGYTYYFDKSGYVLTNQLKQVGEAKYYFCEGGWALTDWIKVDGDWYYGQKDGKILTNDWVNENWYSNENGVCHASYWDKDAKGRWRYRLGSGSYVKDSIRKVNGYTYCFDNSGYMLTNCWKKDGDVKYYFCEGGWALTGKFKVDGVLYNADNEGRVRIG